MSSSGSPHPLDVELADLVAGTLDDVSAVEAERLEEHLTGCLLCRIKCERLRRAPPSAPTSLQLPSPSLAVPVLDEGGDPRPGELWLAGPLDGERLLVVVLRRDGGRALVAPVTLDVEAADDETVVLPADQSPLGLALAVLPALATEVPAAVLSARAGNGHVALDGPSVTTGTPIVGLTDPRLQVRQHLADRLGSLEETPADPATAADAPPLATADFRSALIADLRSRRGDVCRVTATDGWAGLFLASAQEWTPLVTIDEVGIVLELFDTPHGLADDADFEAARSVLTRRNATALVVLARQLSEVADVFDAASLSSGIDLPSGAHTPPRPLITGLSPVDAIAKYLDQHTGTRTMDAPSRGAVRRVDVRDVLREAAAAALADTARQGSRFKIAPKRRGYESVVDTGDAFADALANALEGAFTEASVVEALIEAVRRRGG